PAHPRAFFFASPLAEQLRHFSMSRSVSIPVRPSARRSRAADVSKTRKMKSTGVSVARVRLTRPDKLLYPEAKLSKLDLARYYQAIGARIVPHLRNRPLSLLCCPDGWKAQCFYQKHADKSAHSALSRVKVQEAAGSATYLMANSVSALIALV